MGIYGNQNCLQAFGRSAITIHHHKGAKQIPEQLIFKKLFCFFFFLFCSNYRYNVG